MPSWAGVDVGKRTIVGAVVNADGGVVEALRLPADPEGTQQLVRMLRRHSHRHPERMLIAIEDPHGLLVAKLVAARHQVYAIHPMASARFRERHATSGAKDDRRDAIALANLIRTEAHAHRRVPKNSELAQALFAAVRGQQDQAMQVKGLLDRLHAALVWHYPGALAAFKNLDTRMAFITLQLAPSPASARRLSETRLRKALIGGHIPCAAVRAATILPLIRQTGFRLPDLVEEQYGRRIEGLLSSLEHERAASEVMAERVLQLFGKHPQNRVYASFPALSGVLGARMLAEIGDDLERFNSARGIAALAGVRPVTKASGGHSLVRKRFIYNRRLGHTMHMWGLQLVLRCPAAQLLHERYRTRGDSYCTALRKMTCVYVEILFSCLRSGQLYDEARAFARFSSETERQIALQASAGSPTDITSSSGTIAGRPTKPVLTTSTSPSTSAVPKKRSSSVSTTTMAPRAKKVPTKGASHAASSKSDASARATSRRGNKVAV
jgi:transposase